jgi:hypothetical protein
MPEQTDPYAIQYSESGRTSRKELPPEAMSALFDVLDALAANPDAFPGRVRAISRDGSIRLYTHPSPPLQVTYEVDASRRVLYLEHFVAPKVQVTKPVFISYSHKDAKWLEKLKQFLRPLEDQELIRVWDDTEIRPGSDWLDEIRKALESARVAKNVSMPTKTASGRSRTNVAKAASISRLVLARRTWICSPMARPADCTSLNVVSIIGPLAGLTSTTIRAAPGTISRKSSSRFAVNSPLKLLTPVRLPPGRARLVTRPSLTGSSPTMKRWG